MTNGKSPGSDGYTADFYKFSYNCLVFSLINLPFIKPFCVSLIINGNRGLILLAITNVQQKLFNQLIDLQLPIKRLSFPSFGIHVMTP
jgi:hypothetical protein